MSPAMRAGCGLFAGGLGRVACLRAIIAGLGVGVGFGRGNALGVGAMAAETGGRAIACDVTSASGAEAAFAEIDATLGPARILVNCAGIGAAKRIVGRDGAQALADFEKVVQVNLIGTFNMMRLAMARMTTLEPLPGGQRGVIVSTASIAAYDGQIGQAAYAASKGGVVALTLPAAREMAQFGIRVMAIAPGLFLTPLLQALPQDAQTSLAAAIPFPPRLGVPDEFAALVAHIVANDYLNGEVIRLDGALRMGRTTLARAKKLVTA
eukprot:gene5692-7721_t